MAFGSVAAGAGVQASSDVLGQYQSFGLNALSASKSWDRWKRAQVVGPTLAVRGLRRAGLNPALAAGGGFQASARPGAMQAHSVSRSGPAGGTMVSQANLMDSQIALNNENRATSAALGQKYKAENRLTDTRQYIESLDIAKQEALNAFFRTKEGIAIAQAMPSSAIAPKSWAEAVSRGSLALATNPKLRAEIQQMIQAAPASIRDMLMRILFGGNDDE